MGFFTKDVGVGLAELLLVKGVAETLAALGHLLVHLFLDLGKVFLDKDVGAITLL